MRLLLVEGRPFESSVVQAAAAGYDSVQFLAHVDHVNYQFDTKNTGRPGFDYMGLEVVAQPVHTVALPWPAPADQCPPGVICSPSLAPPASLSPPRHARRAHELKR